MISDKILGIIDTTLYYTSTKDGRELADKLTALMCYREVKAYFSCFNNFCDQEDWSPVDGDIAGHLCDDYPEDMIQCAIEQVKTELE